MNTFSFLLHFLKSLEKPPHIYLFIYFLQFILFYFIFKFYIIVLVLPNIKMNPPQVCHVVKMWPIWWKLAEGFWEGIPLLIKVIDVLSAAFLPSPCMWREGRSVVSDSLWPHWPYSPQNSPGQNTGAGSLSLLRDLRNPGIKPRSPALQVDSLRAEPLEKPFPCIDA